MYYRKLYWSDWNRVKPLISRANLDGTTVEDFINKDIALPNGIVVLQSRQELCWVDAGWSASCFCNRHLI